MNEPREPQRESWAVDQTGGQRPQASSSWNRTTGSTPVNPSNAWSGGNAMAGNDSPTINRRPQYPIDDLTGTAHWEKGSQGTERI